MSQESGSTSLKGRFSKLLHPRSSRSRNPSKDDNKRKQTATSSTTSRSQSRAPLKASAEAQPEATDVVSTPARSHSRESTTSTEIQPSAVSITSVASAPSATAAATDIVKKALEKLKPEQQTLLAQYSDSDFTTIVQRADELRKESENNLTWHFRGYEIKPRELATAVFKKMEQFQAVGDKLSSLDPIHAGLPWAGVKAIMSVALASDAQRCLLLEGVKYVLEYSERLKMYVQMLDSKSQLLEERLVETYACLLGFLADAIQTYKMNAPRRVLQAFWNMEKLSKFADKMEKCRDKLREDAELKASQIGSESLNTIKQQSAKLDDISRMIKEKDEEDKLSSLDRHVVGRATWNGYGNPHSRCLENTREKLLQDIDDWLSQDKFIFWLCGPAGTGKSTIAFTVAEKLGGEKLESEKLASFFFNRTEDARNNASRLFPTLVRQLAYKIPKMSAYVATALEDPLVCTSGIDFQFQKLLLEPLRQCGTIADIYIVLDALDECVDQDNQHALSSLLKLNGLAGIRVKIFITSRPEHPIIQRFGRISNELHDDINLAEVEGTEHDIRVFIDHSLAEISSGLNTQWPEEGQVEILTEISTPLFIAASTYCKFISEDPEQRLSEIITKRPTLENRYLPVLEHMLKRMMVDAPEKRVMSDFREFVGAIVLILEPLSVDDLAVLLGKRPHVMVRHLQSILETAGSITFHLSFRDYLLNEELDHPFRINQQETNRALLKHCLKVMDGLHYDMCDVDHIGTLREEISDISNISPAMRYACRHWITHAVDSKDLDVIKDFSEKLLYWIEVMSWLEEIPKAITDLIALSRATGNEFIADAVKFLVSQRTAIELAPLQTYISALHFSSPENRVRAHYAKLHAEWTKPWFVRMQTCEERLVTPRWTRPYVVLHAVLSHNGRFIALLTSSKTVMHCEAMTGSTIRTFTVDIESNLRLHEKLGMTYTVDNTKLIVWDDRMIITLGLLNHQVTTTKFEATEVLAVSGDGGLAILRQDNAEDNAVDLTKLIKHSRLLEHQPANNNDKILDLVGNWVVENHAPLVFDQSLVYLVRLQEGISTSPSPYPHHRNDHKGRFFIFNDFQAAVCCDSSLQGDSKTLTEFRIWDTRSAKLFRKALFWGVVLDYALSPTGLLAMTSLRWTSIYDLTTSGFVHRSRSSISNGDSFWIRVSFAYQEGECLISSSSEGNYDIHRLAEDEVAHVRFPSARGLLITHLSEFRQALFTSSESKESSLNDAVVGSELMLMRQSKPAFLSTDLSSLTFCVAGYDGSFQAWHMDGMRVGVPSNPAGDRKLTAIQVSAGGRYAVGALSHLASENETILKIWSTETGKEISQLDIDKYPLEEVSQWGRFASMAISSDGHKVAHLGEGEQDILSCYIVDAGSGDTRRLPLQGIQGMIFLPDDQSILLVQQSPTESASKLDCHFCVFEVKEGHLLDSVKLTIEDWEESQPTLHWSTQCAQLRSGCQFPTLKVCDLELHFMFKHTPHAKASGSWLWRLGKRYLYRPGDSYESLIEMGRTIAIADTADRVSFYEFAERPEDNDRMVAHERMWSPRLIRQGSKLFDSSSETLPTKDETESCRSQ